MGTLKIKNKANGLVSHTTTDVWANADKDFKKRFTVVSENNSKPILAKDLAELKDLEVNDKKSPKK